MGFSKGLSSANAWLLAIIVSSVWLRGCERRRRPAAVAAWPLRSAAALALAPAGSSRRRRVWE